MPTANLLKKKRIVVLGSRSVGKSALILQYLEGRFVENYYPTIEGSFQRRIAHNGNEYDCEIIDTAGQDEFSLVNANHTIGTHGYIIVYSVASRNSLDMVKILYDRILDFCGVQQVPCVIVGSKSDLQQYRQIEATEAQEFARLNNAAWIETSAKKNVNVAKVFELCLSEIEKRSHLNAAYKPPPPPTNKGGCIIM
ncbi:GTP-binding protein rhb1 [Leucoagaricus sp. SymC.cos]|nr:GTP-binding protein rhb1 [Leucoagaricus sp. SymC.cos]